MELTRTIWLVSTGIVVWTVLVEELIVGSGDTLRGKVITHGLHPHGDCERFVLMSCDVFQHNKSLRRNKLYSCTYTHLCI